MMPLAVGPAPNGLSVMVHFTVAGFALASSSYFMTNVASALFSVNVSLVMVTVHGLSCSAADFSPFFSPERIVQVPIIFDASNVSSSAALPAGTTSSRPHTPSDNHTFIVLSLTQEKGETATDVHMNISPLPAL